MGLFPSVKGPTPGAPQPGDAANVGNPLTVPKRAARETGKSADNFRASVMEMPVLILAVGYLYHKAFVAGVDDRAFGMADILLVLAIAYTIKRVAVDARWGA